MFKTLTSDKKSFILLFSVELWERWAYYGMAALLALYFVNQMGFSDEKSYSTFGTFIALLYILPSYGGFLCDKYIGAKRTLILGAAILCFGYGLLSFSHQIYLPLALVVVGGGIFKPNPSRLISKIYEADTSKLSSAFTLFYMSINIGELLSIAITPIVAKYYNFQAAFGISFIGMLAALTNFIYMQHLLKNINTKAGLNKIRLEQWTIITCSLVGLIFICVWLLQHANFTSIIMVVASIAVLVYSVRESMHCTPAEKKRLLLAIILIFQAITFFIIYLQIPTTMNLFALRNVQHYLLGIPVSPATFQMLNPFWIIVLSPMLAWAYSKLNQINKDPSIAFKFALGTFLTGVSMLFIPLGTIFAKHGVMNSNWFFLVYGFQTSGELLVSALGLAMVSAYMPKHMTGFALGAWYIALALAGSLSGNIARFASIPKGIASPVKTLPIYVHYFTTIGCIALILGIVFLSIAPLLNKLAIETEPKKHFSNAD